MVGSRSIPRDVRSVLEEPPATGRSMMGLVHGPRPLIGSGDELDAYTRARRRSAGLGSGEPVPVPQYPAGGNGTAASNSLDPDNFTYRSSAREIL